MMDFNDMFMNLSSQWNYNSDVLVLNVPGAQCMCVSCLCRSVFICVGVCICVSVYAWS